MTDHPCELQAAVLPDGVGVQLGPATQPPNEEAYTERTYRPPAHSVKPLEAWQGSDPDLAFFELPHVYTWRTVPVSASVTTIAHSFESPFVAEEALQVMRTSKSQAWPRSKYVAGLVPLEAWRPGMGLLAERGGLTVASLPPYALEASADVDAAMRIFAEAPTKDKLPIIGEEGNEAEILAYERVHTDEEIKIEWKRNGDEMSARGTEAHHQAELFFNGLPFRWWSRDAAPLLHFVRTHMVPRGIVAHWTEREIYCADADLAGSIDLIAYDPGSGKHHVIDHKRSDKLQGSEHGFKRMLGELKHLDDCKCAGFALQLSLYQYVLERDYGLTIDERVLLTLHPDVAPYATSVPYLGEEVAFIMERRMALVRARRRAAEADPSLRCARSGAPAVDAVRLADGDVVMEKQAMLLGEPYEPAVDVRGRFEAAVAAVLEDVPAPKFSLSWKRRMPASGAVPFSGAVA